MTEQSQQIFGLIAKLGSQETFATMVIKTAITNLHREEARQERRDEKVVMRDLKYHENYVWKYSVVLAGNVSWLGEVPPCKMLKFSIKACGGILPNHCYKPFLFVFGLTI